MSRAAKWGFAALLLILFSELTAHAQTIHATSCSSSAVQTALSSVSQEDTTVVIPAGTCTWATQVVYDQVHATTIQGQTTCTGTPATSCADNTVINDGIGSDTPVLVINVPAGKFFRLSGITVQNNTFGPEYNGAINVNGQCPPSCSVPNIRIDHIHINKINEIGMVIYNAIGVLDHSYIEMYGANWNGMKIRNPGPSTVGNEAWNSPTQFGSANFFFIEDSTFTGGVTNDCQHGGRFVIRHNNLFNGAGTQSHGTGSGGAGVRGCRAFEIYSNTMQGNPSCGGQACFTAGYMNSGTGLFWGNSVDSNFNHVMVIHSIRRSSTEYPENPTPTGWGYCGTSFNGRGSAWDQNSNAATGYACIDQLGRGVGDLLTGNMFTGTEVNSATGTISWPRQAIEPMYMWMNTGWNGTATSYTTALDGVPVNQDFYDWCDPASTNGCTAFDGTQGVGSGVLASRPGTCTRNPVAYPAGNSPGVGYWATDQHTLYVCTGTNTWTAHYTPYPYPHPLTLGLASGPNPPTNLQVLVR